MKGAHSPLLSKTQQTIFFPKLSFAHLKSTFHATRKNFSTSLCKNTKFLQRGFCNQIEEPRQKKIGSGFLETKLLKFLNFIAIAKGKAQPKIVKEKKEVIPEYDYQEFKTRLTGAKFSMKPRLPTTKETEFAIQNKTKLNSLLITEEENFEMYKNAVESSLLKLLMEKGIAEYPQEEISKEEPPQQAFYKYLLKNSKLNVPLIEPFERIQSFLPHFRILTAKPPILLTREVNGFQKVMSVPEALQILEICPPVTEDEIRDQHKKLILQNHPDNNGSTFLASKINEAKDVLIMAMEQKLEVDEYFSWKRNEMDLKKYFYDESGKQYFDTVSYREETEQSQYEQNEQGEQEDIKETPNRK